MSEANARETFEDERVRRLDPQVANRAAGDVGKAKPELTETANHGGEQTGADRPATGEKTALKPGFAAMAQPVVLGGLAGAVFAVATVFAMTELRPSLDPRVPGLAQQVAGFQQEVYALETAVRGTEVDVVRALEADGVLAERVATQTESIEAAMAEIAEARALLKMEMGPGSVVFGVSAVQLAAAVTEGRPFEAEWVNLYALTEGYDQLRGELSRLMPFAATGAPTAPELRRDLQAIATAQGTPIIDPNSYVSYGLNMLQSGLGIPIGTTAEAQVVSSILTAADRQLSIGDFEGALASMDTLPGQNIAPFREWLIEVGRAATAHEVSTGFQAVSNRALKPSTSQ